MKAIQEGICKVAGSGASVRFAVVAFRDYCDLSSKLEVLGFTSDVQQVCNFLGDLQAKGGGDWCEDVIGGLEQAVQLEWEAKTRIVYLMCDAPPHGHRFRDQEWTVNNGSVNFDDNSEDPRQWGPTDQVLSQTVSQQIHLVGLQYHQVCQKMFQIFTELRAEALHEHGLQTLVFLPSNSAMDFVKCILKSTRQSLQSSLSRSVSVIKPPTYSEADLIGLAENPNILWGEYTKWPLVQVLVTSVNVQVLRVDPQTTKHGTIQRFYIRETPFASGRMRYAFPAVHEDGNRRFVVKVHKTKAYLCFAGLCIEGNDLLFIFSKSRIIRYMFPYQIHCSRF